MSKTPRAGELIRRFLTFQVILLNRAGEEIDPPEEDPAADPPPDEEPKAGEDPPPEEDPAADPPEDPPPEEEGLVRFIASTPTPDRAGDVVLQNWNLDAYNSSPVILWAHDHSIPAIGRGERAEASEGSLVVDVRFDEEDPFAKLVASKVRRGFISTVSVGFRPGKVTPRSSLPDGDPNKGEAGFVLDENELLELSVCNVPMNSEALVQQGRPSVEQRAMLDAFAQLARSVERALAPRSPAPPASKPPASKPPAPPAPTSPARKGSTPTRVADWFDEE